MTSGAHKIVLGLLQMMSGVSALVGFVAAVLLSLRFAYSRVRRRSLSIVNWIAFAACAFIVAVLADGLAFVVDRAPAERVGSPGLWTVFAIVFAILWWLARRSRQQSISEGGG